MFSAMWAGRDFAYRLQTALLTTQNVVAATGPFQRPVIPPIIAEESGIEQLHSSSYRNPQQLPHGAVLVVGAGSSGTQIAMELMRSGRQVVLSVGAHDRPPRRYRGRDFVWWLGVLGKWDAQEVEPGREHVTISVSGADGGHTVDFRQLAEEGLTLVGLTQTFDKGTLTFAPDLAANLAAGDANYLSVLDEADAYIIANGLDFPEEPAARSVFPILSVSAHRSSNWIWSRPVLPQSSGPQAMHRTTTGSTLRYLTVPAGQYIGVE